MTDPDDAKVHSEASGFLGHPSDLTLAEFHEHPVRQAIREAAYGGEQGIPSDSELDGLKLPAAARREVAEAARKAAEIHSGGNQAEAWSAGDEAAAEIIDSLAGGMRRPDYLDEPPPPDPAERDPRALAARVGRTF